MPRRSDFVGPGAPGFFIPDRVKCHVMTNDMGKTRLMCRLSDSRGDMEKIQVDRVIINYRNGVPDEHRSDAWYDDEQERAVMLWLFGPGSLPKCSLKEKFQGEEHLYDELHCKWEND